MVFGLFRKADPVVVDRSLEETTPEEQPVPVAPPPPPPPGFASIRGATVMVTGSSGLCGARLVELCLERGAHTVVAVDLQAPSEALQQRFDDKASSAAGQVVVCSGYEAGDITSEDAMQVAFAKVPQLDMVFHVGGLAGPFFQRQEYLQVNVEGTQRIIAMCQKHQVPKLM